MRLFGLVEWLGACEKQLLKFELGSRFYLILIHLHVHLVSVAVGTAHRYNCRLWEPWSPDPTHAVFKVH